MLRAIERGLTLSDFNEMTLGMILGYITAYNNVHMEDEDKEGTVRIATQDDYDNF